MLVDRRLAIHARRYPQHLPLVARTIRHQIQLGRGEGEGRRRLCDWLLWTSTRGCGGVAEDGSMGGGFAKGGGEGGSRYLGVRNCETSSRAGADGQGAGESWGRQAERVGVGVGYLRPRRCSSDHLIVMQSHVMNTAPGHGDEVRVAATPVARGIVRE